MSDDHALADLGAARFDHDVAAVTQGDAAILSGHPVNVPKFRAPTKELEKKAFAWSTLQYQDEEGNEKEEMKEDLHGGQLHRQNRAARGEPPAAPVRLPGPSGAYGRFGGHDAGFAGSGLGGRAGRGRSGRAGRERAMEDRVDRGMRVAVKPEGECRPEAKGMAIEMSRDMFWDGPIV